MYNNVTDSDEPVLKSAGIEIVAQYWKKTKWLNRTDEKIRWWNINAQLQKRAERNTQVLHMLIFVLTMLLEFIFTFLSFGTWNCKVFETKNIFPMCFQSIWILSNPIQKIYLLNVFFVSLAICLPEA